MKLSSSEIESRLALAPGWSVVDEKLTRELKLGSFEKAFRFMTQVAAVAEELQHHPEWSNVYDFVRIQLTTHDDRGISDLDFGFARRVNEILAKT